MAINNISSYMSSMLTNQMRQTELDVMEAFEKLTSGRRINKASDDPAGLTMATRLEAQMRATAQAEQNAQMGIHMARTAEGYLSSATEDVQRIRELSVQAANGTLTSNDRAAIQQEVDALKENISYNFQSAQFNTKNLFDGHTETMQIGPNAGATMEMNFPAMSLESLGIADLDVTTQAGAEAGITAASGALDNVLTTRSDFGSYENRLTSAIDYLSEARINTASSLSQIRDANIAEEMMNATSAMNSLQAQMFVAKQVMNLEGSLMRSLFD
jgi:flagellin